MRHIIHPSDNSDASHLAFLHALKLAIANKADLTLVHSESDPTWVDQWWHPPRVRKVLEAWGLLHEEAPRREIFEKLGVSVRKAKVSARTPLLGIVRYLDAHDVDLVVLSTRGREGLPRWLNPSVAEQTSRYTDALTLFVPWHCRPFVDSDNGTVMLNSILIPVDRSPDPQRSVEAASEIVQVLRATDCRLRLLHVGDEATYPTPSTPEIAYGSWEKTLQSGAIVNTILGAASAEDTALIVMGTEGRDGIIDALRGSTTEQVLRQSACPVLAVPARR